MKLFNIHEDKLPGGLSAGKPDSDFDKDELELGVKTEMEHTNDPEVAREIAKDHLTEHPRYYSKLKKVFKGEHK